MGGKSMVAGRGRKPKPTSLKSNAGNPGKRKLNSAEPNYSALTAAEPPEWLTENATIMWRLVVSELCNAQVLQVTDLHNVEVFCTAYGTWRTAQAEVADKGVTVEGAMGGVIKNPALTAANEAVRQMATFGALLGLDPSSRSRLIGAGKKAANPFSEF